MSRFGVKRYGGNDFEIHLSVLCPEDLSVSEYLKLPFEKYERVDGGSCGGLLYFHGDKGKIIICNLITKEMKVLPLPYFKPAPHFGNSVYHLNASGFCYDAKSGDYKVIRNCVEYYREEANEKSYCGGKKHFELYSFKCGSWMELPTPDVCIDINGIGVYVGETGRCYWTACIWPDPNSFIRRVVSFDFAAESFDHFPLPGESFEGDTHAMYQLVECRSSLGALVYYESSSSPSSIELFLWKEMSWDMLFVVSFADVARPLCLNDDRLLFLEAKARRRRSQLMVYDLDRNTLKKLNIYEYPGHMSVISYAESTADTVPLPDSIPITMISYVETSEEDREERKTSETGMKLKIRPRLKILTSGRGRKTTRTVFELLPI